MKRACAEDGCPDPVSARGLCSKHYQRWYHRGRHKGEKAQPSLTELRKAADAAGERQCRACGEVKPSVAFEVGSGRRLRWICAPCASLAQRVRYAADGSAARERSRIKGAAVRAVRVPMVNAIKMERGCIDCGYNAHPAALHFDHRDPSTKSFTIAKQLTCRLDRLMAEIAKCDVRCANCHAVRSVVEGHLGRPRIDTTTDEVA